MTYKDIFKYIYWKIAPVAIGFFLFLYLDKMDAHFTKKILIFLVIAIPVATIRLWIGTKIFKEKKTLVDKIMSCKLRKGHGRGYCVKCPDGYVCAPNIEEDNVSR